jgi:ATP:corrinoid adenosyltransferase
MSSNKSAKEALIRRYGKKCFIERLHLRDTSKMKYTGCGQLKRMKQLTYHHILEKSKGGRATVENGALLSCENHEWFHKQPKESQRVMNEMFQELKRRIDYQECQVEYVDEVKCPFEAQFLEIEIKQKIRDKERRQEKRDLQKLRKEYEDR